MHYICIKYSSCNKDYDKEQIDKAVQIVNSIAENMAWQYTEGYRNNIAVDLCCVCHVLEIDPELVARDAGLHSSLINEFMDRVDIIRDYLYRWDKERGGVFSKMFCPDPDDWPELESKDDVYLTVIED